MLLSEFKAAMAKAKPGKPIPYYTGNLAKVRVWDDELDGIARFVAALYEIGAARMYHKREGKKMVYYVVLQKRLRTRRDQSGSFQDAERVMEIV